MSAPSLPVTMLKSLRMPRMNALFSVSLVVVAVMVGAAVGAPWLAPYDPDFVDLSNVLAGPSAAHWLGTDALGRDTLSRMMFGARTSLLGPLLVVLVSTVLGILLGLNSAGWRIIQTSTRYQ